ncbi:MAG: sigma-54 interaction domain-containing protein [Thiotrichales bacterium]
MHDTTDTNPPDAAIGTSMGSEIVGQSAAMQRVFKAIRKVAPDGAPVLITGESGTGKEVVAHKIHRLSERADGPFVAVNCGAIASNLIQSELFGHVKGAFTGAHKTKIGRLESANRGTIFLDEIGDLGLDLQVNLLRFLQEKTIERVGGVESIQLDVRVIAATHVNLINAVKEGKFREDLFYRLNVLQLRLPPLREREEDILAIATHYLHVFVKEQEGSRVEDFTEEAKRVMNAYPWPGNIRELINRVRRAVVMCDTRLITPNDLGMERRDGNRDHMPTLAEVRAMAEQQAINSAIRRNRGNIAAASRQLGVSRVTLYQLMGKYGLAKEHVTSTGN